MLASLRARRACFWYLATDRIVAAVISRAEREPVLEACAASYSSPVAGAGPAPLPGPGTGLAVTGPAGAATLRASKTAGSRFAPGVVEVAWVLGCEKLVHVAALASSFCRMVDADDGDEAALDEELPGRVGAVAGAGNLRVWAEEAAVAQAASLFRRAQLRLLALDCEPCALASLAAALGVAEVEHARRQHLSAVALLPEASQAAEALGRDLAVPVGLAVSWFGAGRAQ